MSLPQCYLASAIMANVEPHDPLVDEKTTKITLDRPVKLILEANGKRHPLFILAHALEEDAPAADDPNVIYFGPGLHRPERGIVEVKSNQTLYLAGGAVVQAAILVNDAENVTIRGRGILDGSSFDRTDLTAFLCFCGRSGK